MTNASPGGPEVAEPLPDPGSGATAARFARLADVAEQSLSRGRLLEGHADAVSILHEAGADEPAGMLAVWASELPGEPVRLVKPGAGRPGVVSGTKAFCSAATTAAWALVTAMPDDAEVALALVDLEDPGVRVHDSVWVGPGMQEAGTRSVEFRSVPVAGVIGGPGWYLSRPGFWHGAVGVAACWLGGARGVVATMRTVGAEDPHGLALLGEAAAEIYAMEATLARAAREIDAAPDDAVGARVRAMLVRTAVERGCRAILDHSALALGPRPLALDGDHSQRVADLQVYLRQHHGRRDHALLGQATQGARSDGPPC